MSQRQFRSDDTSKWVYGFGNGSDGAYSSTGNATDAPIDSSCSGNAGSSSLTATNVSFSAGQIILIHQSRGTGVGNWELNKILNYTAGTITTIHTLINTYTDSGSSQAQVLVLKQYTSFTQNSGHTLTVKAWNGNVGGILAFMCNGNVTISGQLNLSGSVGGSNINGQGSGGATGGGFYGGHVDGIDPSTAWTGEGTAGASYQVSSVNDINGNGGGGGWEGSCGGGGGNALTGGNAHRVYGGSSVGIANLTTITFGGGGGGASGNWQSNGAGGSGGGISIIICKNIIISGSIISTGGNGGNSSANLAGGAGAGGDILIKCQNATLGNNLITALGGTGGTSGSGSGYNGGSGSVGRIHLDYKTSYSGNTNPYVDITNDITIDYPANPALLFTLL
jgi:hypothetical protein